MAWLCTGGTLRGRQTLPAPNRSSPPFSTQCSSFTCAACNAAFMELEAMTAARRAHRVDLAGDGPAQAAVDASVEQLNTIFTSLQQYVGHVMRSCIQLLISAVCDRCCLLPSCQ